MEESLVDFSRRFFEIAKRRFFIKKYQIEMHFTEPAKLPKYKGSTIRGTFGRALKFAACIKKEGLNYQEILDLDCFQCHEIERRDCIYFITFEEKKMKGYFKNTTLPHLYIVEPPEDLKTNYKANNPFNFNLTLIGKTQNFALKYYIDSLIKMGDLGLGEDRSKFQLRTIRDSLNNKSLYTYQDGFNFYHTLESDLSGIELLNIPIKKAFLRFITYTDISYHGREIKGPDLPFAALFSTIFTRLRDLSNIYNRWDFLKGFPYKEFIEKAKKIESHYPKLENHSFDKTSLRTDKTYPIKGLMGEISYEGEITPFLPFLIIGLYTHVGAKTDYGQGQYEFRIS